LTFSSVAKKTGRCRGYFGSWGHAFMAVAVVAGFEQEAMYGMSTRTKKVAVVDRWPLA